MTQQHASVICAFVLRELDHMVGAPDLDRQNVKGEGDVSSRYKGYLKQNLFLLNNTDYDNQRTTGGQENWSRPFENTAGRQIRINLLVSIINGLKRHAIFDRQQLDKLVQGSSDGQQDLITRSLTSFNTCVDAIVDIGERMLLKLPTNAQTCILGGMVVRALLEVHLESDDVVNFGGDQLYVAENESARLLSMIEPLRYANAISNASTVYHLKTSTSRLIGRPSQTVQELVKALFVRDLVDLRISGFGYGDFLVWFGLPLYPSPLLFDYRSNFPQSSEVWAKDEVRLSFCNFWLLVRLAFTTCNLAYQEGADLDYSGLASRYDFTLLLFLREWSSPWTAGNHLSFSFPFRSSVRQLALCAHRFGVPSDIVASVNSFLPRSWWPDDRLSCWCRECQLVDLKNQYRDKILSRQSNWSANDVASIIPPSPPARPKSSLQMLTCKCTVALACSREHIRYLYQEGHKRVCGFPPFRPFSEEDRAFCCDLLRNGDDNAQVATEDAENFFDDDGDGSGDEDGDWESVNSNEELTEERTKSQRILTYFEEKSYKYQQREALPFEDFF